MTRPRYLVLRRAVGQLDALLSNRLRDRMPCELWTMQELVGHIVAAPARFVRSHTSRLGIPAAVASEGLTKAYGFRRIVDRSTIVHICHLTEPEHIRAALTALGVDVPVVAGAAPGLVAELEGPAGRVTLA